MAAVAFGRPFVKQFALCYQTVVCVVCNIGVLWPNGWMDQDTSRYGGRPRPRRHCVRWGLNSPLKKGAQQTSWLFGPCLLWPNGCTDQDTTWYGGKPGSRWCVRWGPSSPNGKGPTLL